MAVIEMLQRVDRDGLQAGDTRVPAAFFRYAMPGYRFAVFPMELNRVTHVRLSDLEAIRTAYREHLRFTPRRGQVVRQTRCASFVAPGSTDQSSGTAPAPLPFSILHLARQAQDALNEANALARELVLLKARWLERRPGDRARVEKLQEMHTDRLHRHMMLRSELEIRLRRHAPAPSRRSLPQRTAAQPTAPRRTSTAPAARFEPVPQLVGS